MDIDDLFLNFVIIISICLAVACCAAIISGTKEQKEVEKCFMQEHKTKECEFVLYKYENR